MVEDQRPKTKEHIYEVHRKIVTVINALEDRAKNHDASKLKSPEREIFDEYTPKLRDTTYGSDEYRDYLKEMKVALDHHYTNNRHHPEFFDRTNIGTTHWNPFKCMNLVDINEMLCDWKAATMRHADGDIRKSIEINQDRFNYTDQMKEILLNTVESFGW